MFYRIILPPPGYQGFMVMECRTRDTHSQAGKLRNQIGTLFFATMEDARSAIPSGATQIAFEPENPAYLELWETPKPPA
jgi:hypothetical protein